MNKCQLAGILIAVCVGLSVEGRAASGWSAKGFKVKFPLHCASWLEEKASEPIPTIGSVWEESLGHALEYSVQDQTEAAIELGFTSLADLQWYFQTIEFYLSKIAEVYDQEFGFPSPDLASTGESKFEVQYRDLSKGGFEDCSKPQETKAISVNTFYCDDRRRVLVLNADIWSPRGRKRRDAEIDKNPAINDSDGGRYDEQGLYSTLAHELFHFIQGAYDRQYKSFQPCGQKDWGLSDEGLVVEGLAQAMAVEMSDRRAKVSDFTPSRHSPDRRVLGGYPFIYNIFDPPKSAAYNLSSLWRYFADRESVSDKDRMFYLSDLLRSPVGSSDPDTIARARWLDGYFRKTPLNSGSEWKPESLYTLFPTAVTEIFSYDQARYTHRRAKGKWTEWLSKKGSGCQWQHIQNEPAKFEIDLAPYSAACFIISWDKLPPKAELHFEAIVEPQGKRRTERYADQLHLGLARREVGTWEEEQTSPGHSGFHSEEAEDCWTWSNVGRKTKQNASCLYKKVRVSSGPRPNTSARWWIPDEETRRDFQKAGQYVLVLSNIAPPDGPDNTLSHTFEISDLVFKVGFGHTSDVNGKPLPPPRGRSMMGSGWLGNLDRWPATLQNGVHRSAAFPAISGSASPLFALSSSVASLIPANLLTGGYVAAGATAGSLVDLGLSNLQSFVIGEAGERQYLVTPVVGLADYELGDTGPLQGEVALLDPDAEETNLRINRLPDDPEDMDKAYTGRIVEGPGSRWCQSGAGAVSLTGGSPTGGRIGTIARSSEDELVIEIDADLCRMTFTWGDQEPKFEVAERAQFTMTLPFGWRYFNKSAPQPVETPGLAWYDDRFPEARQSGNLATRPGPDYTDPFDAMGLSRLGEMPGACACGCDDLLNLNPVTSPECVSVGCINQMAQCQATNKSRETVAFSYRGTISIRALMALRKDYDDRGILNQNLDERKNTITVLYTPSQIQREGVEQFLRDLGVEVIDPGRE